MMVAKASMAFGHSPASVRFVACFSTSRPMHLFLILAIDTASALGRWIWLAILGGELSLSSGQWCVGSRSGGLKIGLSTNSTHTRGPRPER